MRTLVWSAAFLRAFKRAVRHQPELAGAWACTVGYDNRILFEFGRHPDLER